MKSLLLEPEPSSVPWFKNSAPQHKKIFTQSWARDNTAATMWPCFQAKKLLIIALLLHLMGLLYFDTEALMFLYFFFSLKLYYVLQHSVALSFCRVPSSVIYIAPVRACRNCLGPKIFHSGAERGIGYSFQLAITAPLYSITGYCIATAQS